jgi:signal peptidase II
MFYFPLFQTTLPEWLPIWGGRNFMFFRPVFNISDASITIGVFYLLLFQKRFFKHTKEGGDVKDGEKDYVEAVEEFMEESGEARKYHSEN